MKHRQKFDATVPLAMPSSGVLLKAGRGHVPANPITSPVDIAETLKALCGAEGFRIEGNQLLALRWDRDGNQHVIERYEIEPVGA